MPGKPRRYHKLTRNTPPDEMLCVDCGGLRWGMILYQRTNADGSVDPLCDDCYLKIPGVVMEEAAS